MSIYGKYLSFGASSPAPPTPSVPYLEYIRTNHGSFHLTLSNWIYDLADTWEIVYKQNDTSRDYGDYPGIIGTSSASSTKLSAQYNLALNRKVISFIYNDAWTGSNTVSFESPYDYDNFYKIRCVAGKFDILKGPTLDSIETVAGTYTLPSASGDTGLPVILFILNDTNRLDVSFYSLTVWRNGSKIHEYLPIADGVHDAVTEVEYVRHVEDGHINGPLV